MESKDKRAEERKPRNFDEIDDRLKLNHYEKLRTQLDAGNYEVCGQLALCYYYGVGVKRDFSQLYKYSELGAEHGEMEATAFLACCMQNGLGCDPDPKGALENYAKVMASSVRDVIRKFAYSQYALLTVVHDLTSVEVGDLNSKNFKDRIAGIQVDDPEYLDGSLAILKNCDPAFSSEFGLAFAEVLREVGTPKKEAKRFANSLEKKCFNDLFEEAHLGAPLAWAKLALCYSFGLGCKVDIDLARDALTKAADMGIPYAQVKLGNYYEAQEDYDTALRYYKLAADSGNSDGICKEGMLEKRLGNIREALRLFELGEARNHAPSIYALGMFYYESGVDEAKAEALWKRSADLGFGLASEQLGEYYEKQLTKTSPQKKWREVFERYRAAAELGVATAFVHCGRLFKEGLGVEQSDEMAEQYFRQVEEGNDDESKELLAIYRMSCQNGDAEEQLRRFVESDLKGDASVELGRRYLYGDGVERDSERAAWLFGSAAAKGNVVGYGNFGFCAVMGRGMPKDMTAGEFFLRRAAEMDDPGCQYQLGLRLEQDEEHPENAKYGNYWLFKAALQGLPDAASIIARRLWNGAHGLAQDKVSALYWWDAAEAAGLDDASEERVRAMSSDSVARMFRTTAPKYKLPFAKIAPAMARWMNDYAAAFSKRPVRSSFHSCYDLLCDRIETRTAKLPLDFDGAPVNLSDAESTSVDPMDDLIELYNLCEPLPSESNLSCALESPEADFAAFKEKLSSYMSRAIGHAEPKTL